MSEKTLSDKVNVRSDKVIVVSDGVNVISVEVNAIKRRKKTFSGIDFDNRPYAVIVQPIAREIIDDSALKDNENISIYPVAIRRLLRHHSVNKSGEKEPRDQRKKERKKQ